MDIDLTVEDFFQSEKKTWGNLIIDINGTDYILNNIINSKEIIHLNKIKRAILFRLFDNETLIGFCSLQIPKNEELFQSKNHPIILWLDIKNETHIKNNNLKIKIKLIVKKNFNIIITPSINSINTNSLLGNPNLTINHQNSKNLNLFNKYMLDSNYLENNDAILNDNNLASNKNSINDDEKHQTLKSSLADFKKNKILNYSDDNIDYNIMSIKENSKNKNIDDLDIYNKISNTINSEAILPPKVNMKTIENSHKYLGKSKNKDLPICKNRAIRKKFFKNKSHKKLSTSNRNCKNLIKNISSTKILPKKENNVNNDYNDNNNIIVENNKNKRINQQNITNINDKIIYNNINYNYNYGDNLIDKEKTNFKKNNIKLSKTSDVIISQENSNNFEFREASSENHNNYSVEIINENIGNNLLINLDNLELGNNEEDVNHDFEIMTKDFDLLYTQSFISNIHKDLLKLEFQLCFDKILLITDYYNKKMKNLIFKNNKLQKISEQLAYILILLQKKFDKLENKKKLRNFKQNLGVLKKTNNSFLIKNITSEKINQKNLFQNYFIKDNNDNNNLEKKQNNEKNNTENKFDILKKILGRIILRNPNYISLLNTKSNKDESNVEKMENNQKNNERYENSNLNSININNNNKLHCKSQNSLLKQNIKKNNCLNIKNTKLLLKHRSLFFNNLENENNKFNVNRLNTYESYRTKNDIKSNRITKPYMRTIESPQKSNIERRLKINKKGNVFRIFANDNFINNKSGKLRKVNSKTNFRKKSAIK